MTKTVTEALGSRGWGQVPAIMRHDRIASIAPHGDAQFVKDGKALISLSNGQLSANSRGGVTYSDMPGIVINAIWVVPRYRGQKIASAAMADLLAAYRECISAPLDIYVEVCAIGEMDEPDGMDDDLLMDWYLRLGFTPYDHGGPDCLKFRVEPIA